MTQKEYNSLYYIRNKNRIKRYVKKHITKIKKYQKAYSLKHSYRKKKAIIFNGICYYCKKPLFIKKRIRPYITLDKTCGQELCKLEYRKHYNKTHREKINNRQKKYNRTQYKNNIKFYITVRLRTRFSIALQHQNLHKTKSMKLYGISIQDIINHLGPCPGDRKDYHIDHIKPLSSFDLSKEDEIRKAFAPENHQWLLAKDNVRKSNKFIV